MKTTTLIVGLVLVVLAAPAAGGCSSASSSSLASDAGSDSGGVEASADGSGTGGSATPLYCFFEHGGAQVCVGYGGLPASECTQANGTIVPSCPTAGQVGCCFVPPSYEQCWYCPSDPSQLESACATLGTGKWTAGVATCGDSGSSSGGESGDDGGAESGTSSPYDTTCTSSSMTCPDTPLICQTFSFGGGAIMATPAPGPAPRRPTATPRTTPPCSACPSPSARTASSRATPPARRAAPDPWSAWRTRGSRASASVPSRWESPSAVWGLGARRWRPSSVLRLAHEAIRRAVVTLHAGAELVRSVLACLADPRALRSLRVGRRL